MPPNEFEFQTRRDRIDPVLKAQGWSIVPFVEGAVSSNWTHHAVTEYPTANGPADYALFVDGKPFGIIEAKKLSLGPQNVLIQAERYSRGLSDSGFDFRGYKAPFLYSTNGEVVWFHDVRPRMACSRRIKTFHTPAALREKLVMALSVHGSRLNPTITIDCVPTRSKPTLLSNRLSVIPRIK